MWLIFFLYLCGMKRLVLVLFILVLGSCSKERSVPEGILPKDRLVEVIVDLQRAEALVNSKQDTNRAIRDLRAKTYSEQVFEKYGISKEVYIESIEFYSLETKELEELIKSVAIKLN